MPVQADRTVVAPTVQVLPADPITEVLQRPDPIQQEAEVSDHLRLEEAVDHPFQGDL